MRGATLLWVAGLAVCAGCGSDAPADPPPEPEGIVVVTFNTGSNPDMGHDAPPDDGYGTAEADLTDQYYGNGLAWLAVMDDARAFFAEIDADIVAFQEIFHPGDCDMVPADARAGFICDSWQDGDLTVAQSILGEGWQVACHLGKNDKCLAVRERLGRFQGCDDDFCLEGLDGGQVMGCSSGGSRIGRGVIELAEGSTLTVVNVHGSSGLDQSDQDCRVLQFRQVFEDLLDGSGEPAANGERNIIMGDLNTDPGRTFDFDESAAEWNLHVGDGERFHFVSDVGPDAQPSYAGLFNIDHVVSDAFEGSCFSAGLEGHPPVSDITFFDHKPVVCRVDDAE